MWPFDSNEESNLSKNLPRYKSSLENQFNDDEMQSLLERYPNVAPTYARLQRDRVEKSGVAPLSKPVAAAGIRAAGKKQSQTPEPEGNIFQNLASDVGSIVSSIPKLPGALIEEVLNLPNAPKAIEEGINQAQNPLEALGNIAHVPGIRFIPGSYLVGTLGTNQPGLVEGVEHHPLYAALDVLPYASKLARATGTVKAAESLTRANAALSEANDLARVQLRTPPIRTLVENWHPGGPQTEIVPANISGSITKEALKPNLYGRAVNNAESWLAKTRPGAAISTGFGAASRDTVEAVNRANAEIRLDPENLVRNPLERAAFDSGTRWEQIANDFTDLSKEQRIQAWHAAQSDNALDINALSPRQQELVNVTKSEGETLANAMVDEGAAVRIPFRHGDEIYETARGNTILEGRQKILDDWDAVRQSYTEKYSTYDNDGNVVSTEIPDDVAAQLDNIQKALDEYDWDGAHGELAVLKSIDKWDPPAYISGMRTDLRNLNKTEGMYSPARFTEVIRRDFNTRIANDIKSGDLELPPEISKDAALQSLGRADYLKFMDEDTRNAYQAEVESTWRNVAETATHQPIYIHRVTPGRAEKLMTPHFTSRKVGISSTKQRMFDTTHTVQDPIVAMRANTLEIVQKYVADRLLDRIQTMYGIRGDTLKDRMYAIYGDKIERAADPKAMLNELIRREYSPWDPNSFLSKSPLNASLSEVDPSKALYLPKSVKATVDELSSEMASELSRANNPLMKVFRTSVLTLSPRFYLNNLLGGSVLAAGQGNPLALFKYAKTAYHMARDPEALVKLGDVEFSRAGIRGLPAQDPGLQGLVEYVRDIKPNDMGTISDFIWNYEAGKSVKKFMHSLADKGATANAVMDGFYQNINFLNEVEKGLKKGLARDEAIRNGVEQGRRVLETWDRLTPTERTIVKSVFPFYGFTRSLLKYTMQYPTTHPTRLGILSSIAKSEEEDFGSGLPQQFQRLLFLGSVNDDGTVRALSPGGLNPFQDVANYATLLGFITGGEGDLSAVTRNLNPAFSLVLKQMNVDPSRGKADLFPELYLDPVTGQLSARSSNFLVNAANSIVPQTQILTSLLGFSEDYNRLRQTNPAAAGRMLGNALGVPIYPRSVNLPEERYKAEVTRYQQARTELNEALKSGDWSAAEAWPSLRPFIAKLRNMSREQLADYVFKPDEASAIDSIAAAVAGNS